MLKDPRIKRKKIQFTLRKDMGWDGILPRLPSQGRDGFLRLKPFPTLGWDGFSMGYPVGRDIRGITLWDRIFVG